MDRVADVANDRIAATVYSTASGHWAVYRGDRDVLERLHRSEPSYMVEGRLWRPLAGALLRPGAVDDPERVGRSLLLRAEHWRENGCGADIRYVWDDGSQATWLLPSTRPIDAESIWASVSWCGSGHIVSGPVGASMRSYYRREAPSGMRFAEALAWYADPAERRERSPALWWLVGWVCALVAFGLSALTPPPRGVVVPAVLGESAAAARSRLGEEGLRTRTSGGGTVFRQTPGAGSVVPPDTTVRLDLRADQSS